MEQKDRSQASANGTTGVEIRKIEITFTTTSQWTHGNLPVCAMQTWWSSTEDHCMKTSNLRLITKIKTGCHRVIHTQQRNLQLSRGLDIAASGQSTYAQISCLQQSLVTMGSCKSDNKATDSRMIAHRCFFMITTR